MWLLVIFIILTATYGAGMYATQQYHTGFEEGYQEAVKESLKLYQKQQRMISQMELTKSLMEYRMRCLEDALSLHEQKEESPVA